MIWGYIRVSTDKQNTENQRYELEKFAQQRGFVIDKWISEKISSTKALHKRKLSYLLKKVSPGDTIIASELSRFGRNLLQIMTMLNGLLSREILVFTVKDNYSLGTDIESKVLAFAFGLSAEIERNMIVSRTQRCFERMKAEGRTLGRPKGSKNVSSKMDGEINRICRMFAKGYSFTKVAKKVQCARHTLRKYMHNEGVKYCAAEKKLVFYGFDHVDSLGGQSRDQSGRFISYKRNPDEIQNEV